MIIVLTSGATLKKSNSLGRPLERNRQRPLSANNRPVMTAIDAADELLIAVVELMIRLAKRSVTVGAARMFSKPSTELRAVVKCATAISRGVKPLRLQFRTRRRRLDSGDAKPPIWQATTRSRGVVATGTT